jgi:sulfite exporter TauE/SafE
MLMTNELFILIAAAASIAFFHTLMGPDHYLPFIVMSRSGNWSLRKTIWITILCGFGHVLSSVLLGLAGIVFGIAVSEITFFETVRGSLATWVLIAFGLVYFAWGMTNALRNRPHTHKHAHAGQIQHNHSHDHHEDHLHAHSYDKKKSMTPWVLFTIFVLGPCEPLIPMLMYPAAKNSMYAAFLVAGIFGVVTIVTMLGVVLISSFGLNILPSPRTEKYTHAIAGAIVSLSGASMLLFGL